MKCPFDSRPLAAFSSGFEEETQFAEKSQTPILISSPFLALLPHGSVSLWDGQYGLPAVFAAGHCTLPEVRNVDSAASDEKEGRRKPVVCHFLGKRSE